MESAQKRVIEIIRILRESYPKSRTALKFETPLQILVATILSAQCTDERVNQITPSLFRKYRSAADFVQAKKEELEDEIRSAGLFRNKAKSIIGASIKITEDFSGVVPENMEDLISLPGVARKTANIVLSSAYNKAEGIAVDTHVKRLSGRLGLSKQKIPDKIEIDLMVVVLKKDWLDFNYILVNHGRKICKAIKPLCPECGLKHLCPSGQEFYPAIKLND